MSTQYWIRESTIVAAADPIADLLRTVGRESWSIEDGVPIVTTTIPDRTKWSTEEVIDAALNDLRADGWAYTDDALDLRGVVSYEYGYSTEWDPFLAAIAPAVPPGQYIEFEYDCGLFRAVFTGDSVQEIYPTLTWPELDLPLQQ